MRYWKIQRWRGQNPSNHEHQKRTDNPFYNSLLNLSILIATKIQCITKSCQCFFIKVFKPTLVCIITLLPNCRHLIHPGTTLIYVPPATPSRAPTAAYQTFHNVPPAILAFSMTFTRYNYTRAFCFAVSSAWSVLPFSLHVINSSLVFNGKLESHFLKTKTL